MIPGEQIAAGVADALKRVRPAPSPIRDWLRDVLLSPLHRLLSGAIEVVLSSLGPWFGWALLALVGVAALALLVYLASWLHSRESAGRHAAAGLHAMRGGGTAPDPDAADREAVRLAAAGMFAEAVRMLYLATVIRLHRRAGAPFDPSLTPGEHLRGFGKAPFLPTLRAFVREYQGVSFGARPLDGERYARLAALRPEEARP